MDFTLISFVVLVHGKFIAISFPPMKNLRIEVILYEVATMKRMAFSKGIEIHSSEFP